MFKYACSAEHGGKTISWDAGIRLIRRDGDTYEAEISGRGYSFHVIVGPQAGGFYICIPNFNVGSELADPEDAFWNYERLAGSLGEIDAVTVSEGLRHLRRI